MFAQAMRTRKSSVKLEPTHGSRAIVRTFLLHSSMDWAVEWQIRTCALLYVLCWGLSFTILVHCAQSLAFSKPLLPTFAPLGLEILKPFDPIVLC